MLQHVPTVFKQHFWFECHIFFNVCESNSSSPLKQNQHRHNKLQAAPHQIFNRFKVLNNPNIKSVSCSDSKTMECLTIACSVAMYFFERPTRSQLKPSSSHNIFDLFNRHFYCLCGMLFKQGVSSLIFFVFVYFFHRLATGNNPIYKHNSYTEYLEFRAQSKQCNSCKIHRKTPKSNKIQ